MEKDQQVISTEPRRPSSSVDTGLENNRRSTIVVESKWEPGFWKRFPWIGFGALVMVLVALVASVIVLVTSNHVSQSKWPKDAAPNLLLNVMSQIENICFIMAIGNGVAIAWWRKAMKGSSIADLHRSWSYSTSLKEIVFSLKYFNVIALAALIAKLMLIDSTLMQRATSTYQALDAPKPVSNVAGYVNQTFPITGTVTGLNEQPGLMSHWMGDTLKMWSMQGGVYPNQWKGCEGLCFLQVPGIGFAFDCGDETAESVNFGQDLATAFEAGVNKSANLFEIMFDTKYVTAPGILEGEFSDQSSSYLEMNVSYTSANDDGQKLSCPGTKTSQTCRLWPALVKYPVLIQNSSQAFTVSVGGQRLNSISDDMEDLGLFNRNGKQQHGFEVIRQIPIFESHSTSNDSIDSTLSGIQLGLMMFIQGTATMTWDSSLDGSFVISQMGHSANYMTDPPTNPKSCAFQYTDPLNPYAAPNGLFKLPSIVGRINQIMFGLTTDVSLDNPSNTHHDTTKFDATQHKQTIHYLTHFAYMWGAVAATIIFVLLVLPVYWGFWDLGRKVTLNPFEIAYAFRSPVVGQASTAAPEELVQEVGNRQVRYGNIVAGENCGQFGVDETKNVEKPVATKTP